MIQVKVVNYNYILGYNYSNIYLSSPYLDRQRL